MPGATVVGLAFKDGVILGAEKRISYGTYVVSKSGRKVFKISDRVGAACAGMVADMQTLVREMQSLVKIRELEQRRPMPPNSVAKLMSVLLFERRYFPLITQVIIGGIAEKPSIYVLDPLGSLIPDDYSSVGSGAEIAIGIIESGYSPNMDEKSAKELAMRSIKSAVQRDAASGDGVDLLIITKDGLKEESITF
ncbi:MAG: proteasome subunit beta [Nitrososphaerales archaeon]|nr:proteasome subunit beta [Nitrososphaerales archaeon]